MFLRQIEIFGFKSFADRSRIDFAEGITALVGPNGCGKSNVVDAMKWVLGEQASKSLRAEKMEDVIFNGTEARKAQNLAEVTLVFSNEKNDLPLDLPEVSIKRRIYRSGESEYFINNTPVKLKDVRELFYDTGVGKSAYSIMEQGRIDQILSHKPEERRYIFEEAAGITKYKVRGQEAAKKLERTDENIRQVEGILGEVKRSFETLKVQSEKTKMYRLLRKEIFDAEKNLQLLRLKTFMAQKESVKEKLESQTEKRNNLRAEIEQINKTMEASLGEVSTMERQLIDTQKSIYGLQLEKSQFDSQEKLLQERRRVLEEQMLQAKQQLQALAEKINQISSDQTLRRSEKEDLEKRLGEAAQNIADFEASILGAQNRIQNNETEIRKKQQEIQTLTDQQAEDQKKLRQVTDQLVSELDANLKNPGIPWDLLPKMETELGTQAQTLGIFLQGKEALISDILATKKWPQGDGFATLNSWHGDFKEALGLSKSWLEGFEKFRSAVPKFLGEFLSPEGIITQKRDLEARIENAGARMLELRTEIAGLTEENENLRLKIEDYRKNLEDLKLSRERMAAQAQGLEETLQRLNREIAETQIHHDQTQKDLEACQTRGQSLAQDLEKVNGARAEVLAREEAFKLQSAGLEKEISEKNQALLSRERDLKTKTEALSQIQSKLESIQMETAQISTEIKNLYDNFRDKHSVDLAEFEKEFDQIEAPTQDLKDQLSEKKEQLKNLGQVNLMAVEEFAEIQERFNFLSGQLSDLRKAKEDLVQVTKEIQKESTALFLAAFEEIKKNFNTIFRRLFGGGRAELKLLDLDNVLESGIEMYCQPPGKKLENINLLSGGEKSMTAVGLLFATFMVKPSPFCVLDEIDAALDESNVGRFVHMLMEFGETSQFVVITHNKKTMVGAKTMIGVTMEESGISKVMSVRVQGGNGEV